jgi:6-phosphofructokinase 2
MIYTLTMNPAIDMNLTGRDIRPNCVNRTGKIVYSPNGKGVNVSLVLQHFGVQSQVLGFFGGFTGHYIIDALNERQVNSRPIWVKDTTRINIFVNDGDEEYKFVNTGSYVPEEKQQDLLQQLSGLPDFSHLVISGSLPQGVAEEFYDRILEVCAAREIQVILDISSLRLRQLLKYRPLLIKPNDDEVRKVFGFPMETESDIRSAMNNLQIMGAQNILLTMGEKGSWLRSGEALYHCGIQSVRLVSSACAGDAALAAFLSTWLKNGDAVEGLKKSAAAGANVAESNALGDLTKVETYKKNIEVRKVEP